MRLLLERGFSNYSCLSSLTYPVPAWGTQLMECSCELKKPFYLWQQGPQTCDYMEEYTTSQNKRQPTRFSSQGMVGRGKQDGEELRQQSIEMTCAPHPIPPAWAREENSEVEGADSGRDRLTAVLHQLGENPRHLRMQVRRRSRFL